MTFMKGWENPLPIGQSARVHPGGVTVGYCLGARWKKVWPVSRAVRGHSSPIVGPWAQRPPLPTAALCFSDLRATILPTPRVPILPISRVLYCPPPLPAGTLMRPHVTLGHIGGNDLPRQGQRQHLQNV